MIKKLTPLLAIAALVVACESTPHYNRTKVVMMGQTLSKKPYGTVKLYQSKQEVSGNYEVMAIMSVQGNAGEEALFMKAFLYRAADMGADAVIFYRGGVAAGVEGGGWIVGNGGGFGMPYKTTQVGVYRGEAIHFK